MVSAISLGKWPSNMLANAGPTIVWKLATFCEGPTHPPSLRQLSLLTTPAALARRRHALT